MKIPEKIITELYNRYRKNPVVSTDSRRITQGCLFFALKGPSFDGNRFAEAALEQGASCAVVDNSAVAARAAEGKTLDPRCIVVSDTLAALQQLAAHHRRTLSIPVLAITGSNGKTTTKELTARVLASRFPVSVTQGNLNNHIGVPLTLLSIPRDTEFAIVEMGASAQGEIAALCGIARPDYGLITNIGRAHLEGFGGPEGIKKGKGELFDYLDQHHGIAFYRRDDPTLCEMVAARPNLLAKSYPAEWGDLTNHLEGAYNRFNIAAAAAVGEYFGVGQRAIAEAVDEYRPDNHRSQRFTTPHNTLILDCYNANPSSMGAALDNFAADTSVPASQKAVVLGDMLELGDWSAAEHETVVRRVAEMGVGEALLVGKEFEAALKTLSAGNAPGVQAKAGTTDKARAASPAPLPGRELSQTVTIVCPGQESNLRTFPDREALEAWLGEHPLHGKLILVKGSHGIGLEKLAEKL